MKFKILKYDIHETKDIEVDDEDCEYSIGWLELEIEGEIKMLCIERINYLESDNDEIEFGFSDEWSVKSHHVKEWIEKGSDLEDNLYILFDSWWDKLQIDYKDVYNWNSDLVGFEFET